MSAAHAVAVPHERLYCHAADPRSSQSSRAGAPCGKFLGYAVRPVQCVAIADRVPDLPDGRAWVRCARCKKWNVFEDVE